METTFDRFITNDAEQKVLFDKEYAEFSQKEQVLERLSAHKQTSVFSTKRTKSYRSKYAMA